MMNMRNTMLALVLSGTAMLFTSCSSMAGDDNGHMVPSGKTDNVYYDGHYRHSGSPDDRHDGTYDDPAKRRHSGQYVRENNTEAFIDSGLVLVTKHVPADVNFGNEYAMDLEVKALENVRDVMVISTIPDGAEFVRAEPAPTRQSGNDLIWEYARMKHGEINNIKVFFKPMREGELISCTAVHALPLGCVITKAGRAQLGITKSGPATADINSMVTYQVTVSNTGSMTAKDVMINDAVPAGMSGDAQSLSVGDLAAGESKSMSVTFRADRTGQVCNTATASSSNAGNVSADACTLITKKDIEISKSTSTPEQFVSKTANYRVTVRNTGDVPLTGVQVRDMAPAGTTMVEANGGQISGNSASWTVDLNAGESKDFDIVLRGMQPGKLCNQASVSAAGMNKNAEACTMWKGHPAILIEVIDVADPIMVGEDETYKIRVTNQGTADDNNVRVSASFSGELQPLSASGATPGKVEGSRVSFDAYPMLKAGAVIEFTINAKGVKEGDGRIKVELTSDMLKAPVTEEESTHVY